MPYLEEVLPEFRKGAKIRKKHWEKNKYLRFENGKIMTQVDFCVSFNGSDFTDDWEFYQEPEPDWDYIIKNKCLCWFWDDCYEEHRSGGILTCCEGDKYWQDGEDTAWDNCRPARRDEVTFYEDRKDDEGLKSW